MIKGSADLIGYVENRENKKPELSKQILDTNFKDLKSIKKYL